MGEDGANSVDILLLGLEDAVEETADQALIREEIHFLNRCDVLQFLSNNLLHKGDHKEVDSLLLPGDHGCAVELGVTGRGLLVCHTSHRIEDLEVITHLASLEMTRIVHVEEVARMELEDVEDHLEGWLLLASISALLVLVELDGIPVNGWRHIQWLL